MPLSAPRTVRIVGAMLAVVGGAVLTACGSGGSSGAAGDEETVVESVDLSGVEITVGSKAFTEQEVLGQITIEVLQAAGATVEDRTGLASTSAARQALESGATDAYWEYTGTGWLVILDHDKPVPDPRRQFEAVAAEDLRENQIAWIAPAPANNTYAIAVSGAVSDEESEDYDEELAGVETLSDLASLVQQSPDRATICIASEFAKRADGLPGLEEAYGFEFGPDAVSTLDDEDLIYPAVDSGSVCTFGEVFRTDGRVEELDLQLLEDDEEFFASYNPSLTVRQELLDQYPELEELFTPIAESLDDSTLRRLNTQVDVDGVPVEEVARTFLEDEGFVTAQQLTR